MYCAECGEENDDNNYKCTSCGAVLRRPATEIAPPPPPPYAPSDGTFGGLIPTRNPSALTAYYLAVASLIPLLGIFLGIAAFVLGIKGVKFAKAHPEAKGAVHAWVGIIVGGIFGFGYLLVFGAIFLAALSA